MATLKAYQVAAAALLGGFSPNEVPTAVAVARGESSFQTDKCTSQYCGLWQIGTQVNKDHLHGDWKDPVVNARAAKELVSSRGWCGGKASNGHCLNFEAYGLSNAGMSWSAKLKEGAQAYAEVQKRQQAGETLQSMVGTSATNAGFDPKDLLPDFGNLPNPGGEIADAAGAIVGLAQTIIDFGNRLGSWVSDPQSWIRVAEVIGGGLLVALGLRIAFNKQFMAVVKPVISAFVPGGKVSKAATTAVAARKGR